MKHCHTAPTTTRAAFALLALVLALGACARRPAEVTQAFIDTTKGRIVCRLYTDASPEAVNVFKSFANGTMGYYDPREEGQLVHKPLYNGTSFYRAEAGRWIEAGDPGETGEVGPGKRFRASFPPGLSHDRPGLLGMAPYGKSNAYYGSQFYITLAPLPEFDGQRTIIGEVVEGLDVAEMIGNTPVATDAADRVKITGITIVEP